MMLLSEYANKALRVSVFRIKKLTSDQTNLVCKNILVGYSSLCICLQDIEVLE